MTLSFSVNLCAMTLRRLDIVMEKFLVWVSQSLTKLTRESLPYKRTDDRVWDRKIERSTISGREHAVTLL